MSERADNLALRPRFFLRPVPLAEFGAWLLALLCIQYWAGIVAALVSTPSVGAIIEGFTQISVLPLVEWYLLFGLARSFKTEQDVPAALALGSVALIALASTLFAHQHFAFLVETALLCAVWHRTPALKRLGAILLLIALQRLEGIGLLHGLVSRADAWLVEAVETALGHPIARIGNLLFTSETSDGLMVLPGCASTNLIIPMALGLMALLLISRDRLIKTDWYWIAATAAVAGMINIVRLMLMLRGRGAYESMHEGTGASIVSLTGLAVTLTAWLAATGQPRPTSS